MSGNAELKWHSIDMIVSDKAYLEMPQANKLELKKIVVKQQDFTN